MPRTCKINSSWTPGRRVGKLSKTTNGTRNIKAKSGRKVQTTVNTTLTLVASQQAVRPMIARFCMKKATQNIKAKPCWKYQAVVWTTLTLGASHQAVCPIIAMLWKLWSPGAPKVSKAPTA
mmetsp:Transcript_94596/g.246822  ORF Transcript_94596/g.246822 Transcript_94596/m.246822 type:complete len:121 (-) Transcript_94596:633-995(-)